MIAWSEIGPDLLKVSDNGYNVIVGSTAAKPILFTDYSHHPQLHVTSANSDAAGRYQFMGKFWSFYRTFLRLPDFGPASQERWCDQLLGECRAFGDIDAGHIGTAIAKCSSRWASLPGNQYGQHQNRVADLISAYVRAGGIVL